MLQSLWNNRVMVVAVILFAVGFTTLLLHRNLIKKIIGLNIMDTAAYLLLTSIGYIDKNKAPIIVDGVTDPSVYVNPLPAGLVLTGIVVSVSVTAVLLALTIRLYQRYHTLDLDEIYMIARNETEKKEDKK
ncbi:MAG: sodium:proton antiporter [Clostridia bacterium]|nr:sodium:proton antiporter [Clostridia bacterium]